MSDEREALAECARRITAWFKQHDQPDQCAVLALAMKMLREVIAPALQPVAELEPSTDAEGGRERG